MPIPLLPPVTIATLPFSDICVSPLLRRREDIALFQLWQRLASWTGR